MALTIVCPDSHCATRLTLDDDRAGTTFTCPRCGTAISVPILVPPPTPIPPTPTPSPSGSVKSEAYRAARVPLFVGGGLLLVGVVSALFEPCLAVLPILLALLIVPLSGTIIVSRRWNVCNVCGEWQAVECTKEETVSQKKCFGIVIRHGYSPGRASSGPPPVSHAPGIEATAWEERVPTIRWVVARHYQCRYCAKVWAEESEYEEEDFEPDEPLPPLAP